MVGVSSSLIIPLRERQPSEDKSASSTDRPSSHSVLLAVAGIVLAEYPYLGRMCDALACSLAGLRSTCWSCESAAGLQVTR
jgi:hypothetical protein